MKNSSGLFRWFLILIALIALAGVIYWILILRPQTGGQAKDLQALQERLQQLNIPVKSLTITHPTPLELEVILNSSGSPGHLSQVDMLNKFLAVREIELAYLYFGLSVQSYRLMLVTPQGDALYDSTIFLNDDLPSQQLKPAPSSTVDAAAAKEILENELDLQGLRLLSLEIFPNFSTSASGKFFTLDLSTGTDAGNTDNAQIGRFIESLHPQIEDINNRHGAHIVIMQVRIQDEDGRLLVVYLEDFETGKQSSWIDENNVEGWYPQPAPAVDVESEATATPKLPPASATNPAPTASLTRNAYP